MSRLSRFEDVVLPHLDAAYNLARWLTRNDADAEDVVQEAFLRAMRYFERLKGTEARPWLLAIVRNTCYTWLEKNRPTDLVGPWTTWARSHRTWKPSATRRRPKATRR